MLRHSAVTVAYFKRHTTNCGQEVQMSIKFDRLILIRIFGFTVTILQARLISHTMLIFFS